MGRTAIIDPEDPAVIEAVAQRSKTGRFRGVLTLHRKDGTRLQALFSHSICPVCYEREFGEEDDAKKT